MVILIKKTMRAYSKVMILSLKNYENILKFNFLMPSPPSSLREIDYLGKYIRGGILSQ